jgi:hypothetical protein
VLIADMRKKHHVTPLPVRCRAMLPSTKATICDPHNPTGLGLGKTTAIVIKEGKLHGF